MNVYLKLYIAGIIIYTALNIISVIKKGFYNWINMDTKEVFYALNNVKPAKQTVAALVIAATLLATMSILMCIWPVSIAIDIHLHLKKKRMIQRK